MPRREPTPLRWTDQAEARRVCEKALLAHHRDEQFPQTLRPSPSEQAAGPLSLLAAAFAWVFCEPQRPAEREAKWRDSVM